MNLLGKIFVGLIAVMSLVFMSFAMMVYGTHRNWKAEIEREDKNSPDKGGWKQKLIVKQEENKKLEELKESLQTTLSKEVDSKMAQLAKLQSELNAKTGELKVEIGRAHV